jgi:hypothetical protein
MNKELGFPSHQSDSRKPYGISWFSPLGAWSLWRTGWTMTLCPCPQVLHIPSPKPLATNSAPLLGGLSQGHKLTTVSAVSAVLMKHHMSRWSAWFGPSIFAEDPSIGAAFYHLPTRQSALYPFSRTVRPCPPISTSMGDSLRSSRTHLQPQLCLRAVLVVVWPTPARRPEQREEAGAREPEACPWTSRVWDSHLEEAARQPKRRNHLRNRRTKKPGWRSRKWHGVIWK